MKFALALLFKLAGKKGGFQWLPPEESERICSMEDLSPEAKETLAPVARRMESLGYPEGVYSRIAVNLNPKIPQVFGYMAIHKDGKRTLQAAFTLTLSTPPGGRKTTVSLSGGMLMAEMRQINFVSHRNYLDDGGKSIRVKIDTPTLEAIDGAMVAYIGKNGPLLKSFDSVVDFKRDYMKLSREAWDARIARGLFSRISKDKENAILLKLKTPLPDGLRGSSSTPSK